MVSCSQSVRHCLVYAIAVVHRSFIRVEMRLLLLFIDPSSFGADDEMKRNRDGEKRIEATATRYDEAK